jgi:DNA-binding IclR family transcriptional regulator
MKMTETVSGQNGMKGDTDKKGGVDAVERGLAILAAFEDGAAQLTLAEVARRTGLYKSTILRIASSLEAKRFLHRRADGVFQLGPELWRLGNVYRNSFHIGLYVRPVLQSLTDTTEETASFYVREGQQRVCLYRVNSPRSARHHLEEGVRLPVGQGASGRILLAYTEIGDPTFEDIRQAGLVISRGERDPEVAAVSTPVIDQKGRLHGALSVSTLISRFDAELEARIIPALQIASQKLSELIPPE